MTSIAPLNQAAPPTAPTPAHDPMGGAVKRPGTLTALLVTSVLSAVATAIGALIVFAGGTGLAEENVKEVIEEQPDVVGLPAGTTAADIKELTGPIWDAMIDDRAGTLTARAVFALFTAVCVLVFALCVRKSAAVWARVLVTLSAVVAVFPHILILGDYEPDSVFLTSLLALFATLAALVVCWLPGTNRFAKQLKSTA
ncbi:hypothetical protein ACFQVC_05990 [Streptomyces monticola]|uniref:Uncharacterized protein n=1 Tax=Streptomyces monticola TaxID=2666263 RepID=A0ABW2JDL2_9ACTN